jgi:hypothetical protein
VSVPGGETSSTDSAASPNNGTPAPPSLACRHLAFWFASPTWHLHATSHLPPTTPAATERLSLPSEPVNQSAREFLFALKVALREACPRPRVRGTILISQAPVDFKAAPHCTELNCTDTACSDLNYRCYAGLLHTDIHTTLLPLFTSLRLSLSLAHSPRPPEPLLLPPLPSGVVPLSAVTAATNALGSLQMKCVNHVFLLWET